MRHGAIDVTQLFKVFQIDVQFLLYLHTFPFGYKSDEIFHNEKRRISSRVVITTDSGDSFEETVAAPRGSPTYPISENEITEKYLKMAVPVVGLENALELKNFILEIDAQQCVSTLSRLISV